MSHFRAWTSLHQRRYSILTASPYSIRICTGLGTSFLFRYLFEIDPAVLTPVSLWDERVLACFPFPHNRWFDRRPESYHRSRDAPISLKRWRPSLRFRVFLVDRNQVCPVFRVPLYRSYISYYSYWILVIAVFKWFDDIAEVHILFMRSKVVFILKELIGECIFRIILVFPTDHKPAGLYN